MRFSVVATALLAAGAEAHHRGGRPSWNWWGDRPTQAVPSGDVPTSAPVPTFVTSSAIVAPKPTTLLTRTSAVVTTVTAPSAPEETTVEEPEAPVENPVEAPVESESGASSLTSDQQAALDAHNAARAEVGTAALVWDAALAADAQKWADNLASTGSFQHSGVSGQGENLYMQSNSDSPFLNAANAYISEKSAYNGEVISGSNYMNFGHYTQVVWKDTTKVGMAVAKGSSGSYVVCRYTAPGNMIGSKPY